MSKKVLSIALILAFSAIMFCSCEPTPDEVAKEENTVTLENIAWSIDVEGGSAATYTVEDARKHDLTKITTSIFTQLVGGDNVKASQASFVMEGVSLADFLADMGKDSSATVHYYGTDTYGEPIDYELTADDMAKADKIVIGWICNKKSVLNYSLKYVGLFFDSSSKAEGCISLDKLVIS